MITITGATGRTGRAATEALLATGKKVRAVSRDAKRLEALVQLGAEPFVANAEDAAGLTEAFQGASAVYLVLPEDMAQQDLRAHQERISEAFAVAIRNAGVQFVVNLSSMGAQHEKNTGPIVGLHRQEEKLNRISGLNVLHLRAAYFMENLFMSIAPLRLAGMMPGGFAAETPMPWIATRDIGEYAAGRLAACDFKGSSIQELHGQRDISMKESARIVGNAIGKPNLEYVQVPSVILGQELQKMGLAQKTADLIVEMWDGANAGLMAPQEKRSVKNTTPTTIESFVSGAFAPAYLRAA